MILRQSTPTDELIGPFVDITDGATAETGESPAVKLSKSGQALGAKSDATTPVHDDDGYYNCELDATDTNTVGRLVLTVAASATALPIRHEFQVIEEAIYDALYAGSAAAFDANQRVDVGAFLGTAVAAATASGEVAANVTEWLGTVVTAQTAGRPDVNIRAINNNTNSSSVLSKIHSVSLSGIADSGTTTTMVDAARTQADDAWNGSLLIFTAGTNAGFSAIVTDFDADTDTVTFTPAVPNAVTTEDYIMAKGLGFAMVEAWLGTAVTLGSGAPDVNIASTDDIDLSATQKASVNTEVDDAIETYGLDHLVFASVTGTDVADNSIIAKLVDDAATADWDNYDNTTASLEALNVDTDKIIDLVNGLGGSTGGSVSIQTLLDNTVTDTTDAAAAVDKGTSPETVGVPVTGHAFVAGQQVTLAGTTNYNGSFDVDSVTTDEVVIIATFTAETFGGTDTIVSTVKTISFVGSVQAGTVASTEALDGVIHDIDDDGNDDIDLIYTFSVGAGRTATEIIFHGFVQGNGDTIDIEVYDHVGTDWEILRTITGSNGTNNVTLEVPLLLKHTGTSGFDTGRVYVRFDTNATTPSNLSIDQLLVEAINTGALNAYENGQIWLNTNASNTNTVADVDGTTRRPVSTIAALKELSTKTGLGDFHIINGSSFTLAESTVNESYFGDNWTLALGSQNVAGAYFQGAIVSGVGTSATEVHFEGCDVATMSVQKGHFDFCSFDGTVTHTLAGDYNYHNCYSKVAGAGGPTFTKTAGQDITAQFRNWAGSITMSGIQASDVMTISGTELGDVVLNGADGTVKILGIYESLTDNRTGSPTLIEGAFEGSDVTDIEARTLAAGPFAQLTQNLENCLTGTASGTPTTTTMISDIGVTIDDQFKGRIITFDDDTTTAALRRASTDITACTAVSNTLTFTELTTAPVSGDTFVIT